MMELLLIADRDAVQKHLPSLALFEERIHLPAFPDPDEREAFATILDRIGAAGAVPQSFVVLACRQQTIVGGVVFDWYGRMGALEIIYLATSAGERRQGIARTLLSEGVARMGAHLASRGEARRCRTSIWRRTSRRAYRAGATAWTRCKGWRSSAASAPCMSRFPTCSRRCRPPRHRRPRSTCSAFRSSMRTAHASKGGGSPIF